MHMEIKLLPFKYSSKLNVLKQSTYDKFNGREMVNDHSYKEKYRFMALSVNVKNVTRINFVCE